MNNSAKPQGFDTDVAIVGGGPVGHLLAILLGQRGKRVTLIERWTTYYPLPRAVTFDHEIARILATLGINAETDPAINFHDELYYWRNRDGEDLQIVDWQSKSASGWRVRYWFNQPYLEERLMEIANQLETVEIIRGWEAAEMVQDAESVTLTLRRNPEEGGRPDETRQLRAKFVAGTDGANSFVRETLGIENEDRGYFFDWLILDMIPDFDYVASRPHEPAQWQLCDPVRPTTIVPGGPGPVAGGPDRRRWEYMVLPGEDATELQKPENAWKLLEPWGITPENSQLERAAVYRFQARWAKLWNKGRCLIGGDAAHLMPPFAGEGMCAGVRDALAMAWRLNGILEGKYGLEALDSYTTERVEHAKHYINFSQELGQIICIADEAEAAKRDKEMIADLAARNHTPVPTDICHLGHGAWCQDSAHSGELSVQGVVEANGKVDLFDQAVGQGWVLIGYDTDPMAVLSAAQKAQLASLEGFGVQMSAQAGQANVLDREGTYKAWMEEIDARYVLIRPDFYVALTANSPEALRERFDKVMQSLNVPAVEAALSA
ncbi:bifunctional 3-(3-hydroxy-phenyl)propionate/3-hydroxycinnamic acid hydroxylase [Thioclava sp. FTW29]|uniref:Bifunctional 3-(3-hydroxy-phenyl)propionate/3-hydroxycinnamic acid hydroxylase n=1 Tax=Thioclava litoralis TaxID=3076557 RepID=A0ABZ1E496_9RHOB|nr:bifunctional 3-(3-hydroxy-phenyl)propionate/3-hydroxycinnamic acid hydroxylase [Thioclava sp. FTW29]